MNRNIIQERLESYRIESSQDEMNALKEICQEIALAALGQTNFFTKAAFQGGTCLRIFYQLRRFSEDLDFISLEKSFDFSWDCYLDDIQKQFDKFGLSMSIKDKKEAQGAVRTAFLKEESFGKVLTLHYPRNSKDQRKIMIKLEIDTNPPSGSGFEKKYLTFPFFTSVLAQDQPSLFAGKIHALLARPYCKGRDWWDFIWYMNRKSKINMAFLQAALDQRGPFEGRLKKSELSDIKQWLVERVEHIEINTLLDDVKRFLPEEELVLLSTWSTEMFLYYIDQL